MLQQNRLWDFLDHEKRGGPAEVVYAKLAENHVKAALEQHGEKLLETISGKLVSDFQ